MKSLKERLEEKRIREEKEAMKLTGDVKCFTVRLPYNGFPYCSSKGDIEYVKGKATSLVEKVKRHCSVEFWNFIKEAIVAKEDEQEARRLARRSLWDNVRAIGTPRFTSVTLQEDGTIKDSMGNIYTPKPKPIPAPLTTAAVKPVEMPIIPSTVSANGEPISPVELPDGTENHVDDIRPPAGWRLQTEPALNNAELMEAYANSAINPSFFGTLTLNPPTVNSLSEEERAAKIKRVQEISDTLRGFEAELKDLTQQLEETDNDMTPEQEDAIIQALPSLTDIGQPMTRPTQRALRHADAIYTGRVAMDSNATIDHILPITTPITTPPVNP